MTHLWQSTDRYRQSQVRDYYRDKAQVTQPSGGDPSQQFRWRFQVATAIRRAGEPYIANGQLSHLTPTTPAEKDATALLKVAIYRDLGHLKSALAYSRQIGPSPAQRLLDFTLSTLIEEEGLSSLYHYLTKSSGFDMALLQGELLWLTLMGPSIPDGSALTLASLSGEFSWLLGGLSALKAEDPAKFGPII